MKYGRQKMLISETSFREASTGNPGVVMHGTVGDESMEAVIWITEKSVGMAHKALKNCGFDSDAQDLSELQANPALLRGKDVEVLVSDEPPYGLKVEIMLNSPLSEAKLKSANTLLKSRTKAAPAEDMPF